MIARGGCGGVNAFFSYLNVYGYSLELYQDVWGFGLAKNDLQGTLDLLVLKTLSQMGALHGYGIVLHIQRASDSLLSVEEGPLYQALHRMEQNHWIASHWSLTETGRR